MSAEIQETAIPASTPTANESPVAAAHVDFDIQGVVGVRLIDPEPDDIKMVTRQLGLRRSPGLAEPDVIVRFTERLDTPNLTYLGLNKAGFSEEGFFVLGFKSGVVEARVPIETVGATCEIDCLHGLDEVPLLVDVVSLAFLKRDYVALHASAFLYDGKGVLVMGWEKGGKTEALLSFINQGARYVGDELILISGDGARMIGIPIPMAIWDWQLRFLRNIELPIGRIQRIAFWGIRSLDRLYKRLLGGRAGRTAPVRFLGRALPMLRRQLKSWHLPRKIFGDTMVTDELAPEKVFLLMSHSDEATVVDPCDPEEIAKRMKSSNEYERTRFFQFYRAFKFAFPDLRNEFLEGVDERQGSLLMHALRGKDTYKVLHPYPVDLDELYRRMRPRIAGARPAV